MLAINQRLEDAVDDDGFDGWNYLRQSRPRPRSADAAVSSSSFRDVVDTTLSNDRVRWNLRYGVT